MSQSRLEKIGTIFSRVTVLLRSGVMAREDKPLWYDVYQVFPPKIEPSYATRRPKPEIQVILYPEDSIRAKFHKRVQKRLPFRDLLQETTNDLTRRAIDLTEDLMRKDSSLNEDQAVERVIEIFKKEGSIKPRGYRGQKDADSKRVSAEHDKDADSENVINEDRGPVKTISDKNIDVNKFIKD